MRIRPSRQDERGMVSILVTMIMIIVISLIVIGFAQVSRRNQREALDNQLSTQAYYAAESGVNAAIQYFSAHPIPDAALDTPSGDCKYFINNYLTPQNSYGSINVLDSASSTQYTCLLVNPAPGSLEATPVTQDSNTVWHLANDSSLAFKSLTFKWAGQAQSKQPSNCPANAHLPAYSAWNCRFGILRLDLVNTASVNGAALESNTGVTTFYLIPSSSGSGTISIPAGAPQPAANCSGASCPAQIFSAKCPTSASDLTCSTTINLASGSTDYYARITMLYRDASDLLLTGVDSAGAPSRFKGAQALIDSTGQSQDELRRVQVRVPLTAPSSAMPGYDVSSTDSVCKQINAGPGVPYLDSCPATP